MAWVSLLSRNKNSTKWFIMQCIKQGSTLRVSPKKDKPCPRVVFHYGSQDNQVREYLIYRKVIKGIIEKFLVEKEFSKENKKREIQVYVDGNSELSEILPKR